MELINKFLASGFSFLAYANDLYSSFRENRCANIAAAGTRASANLLTRRLFRE